ncbi:hypothetical protein ABZV34_23880 [Streptomyces sp. NPDC005195]|uniref:hypothetical protein n=1 Tax=Streptomyces sp. NPDC005195 TaxID=3154561 RepID=UPI0033B011AE
MTISSDDGNSQERAPRRHCLNQVICRASGRIRPMRSNLSRLWQHESVARTRFTAAITLTGAFLLAQVAPHATGLSAAIDGTLATIDQPVRRYLLTHAQALPITAAAAYGVWQALGLASFAASVFYNRAARLTWTVWGATTVIMVWIATPAPGREVAAGLALLTWVVLSGIALRGLRLRPAAFVQVDVHNEALAPPDVEVHAEIHTPQTQQAYYLPYAPPYLPPSPN